MLCRIYALITGMNHVFQVMVLLACTVWIEEFESLQTRAVTSDTGRFLVDGLCGEFGLVAVRV